MTPLSPTVDDLRDHVDPQLEPASTQAYLRVNEDPARDVALPEAGPD